MKRYFQISLKEPSGRVIGPVGVVAGPDTTANLTAAQVAQNTALATGPEGSSLAYFQDLGQVDIEG